MEDLHSLCYRVRKNFAPTTFLNVPYQSYLIINAYFYNLALFICTLRVHNLLS